MDKAHMDKPVKVAEGGYGCVFTPPLKCKNNNHKEMMNKNYVAKLMKKKHAYTELKEYKTIQDIDPDNKYYLGVPKVCYPELDIDFMDSVSKCKVLEYVPSNTIDELIMENGGPSLDKIFKKTPLPLNEKSAEKIFVDFYNAFKAVELFSSKGVLHNDLKPHNIVYNPDKRKVMIIDMGLMTTVPKYKEELTEMSKPFAHFNYPPELYFITLQYIDPDWEHNKNHHFQESAEVLNQLLTWIPLPEHEIESYISAYKTTIDDLIKNNSDKYFSQFVDKFVETLDVFGIGLTLKFMIIRAGHLLEKETKKQIEMIADRCMDPNVMTRLTPSDALSQYATCLLSTGLAQKTHRKIVDGELVPLSSPGKDDLKAVEKLIKKTRPSKSGLNEKIASDPKIPLEKLCPEGKEINLRTRRCIKVCGMDEKRNPKTNRCVKLVKKKRQRKNIVCPSGKEWNEKSRRCLKRCGWLKRRNPATNRCVKIPPE